MYCFTPMLAEIADKMPSLDVVWERWIVIGLFAELLTAGLSMIRLWAGGVVVGLCDVPGMLASASDCIMDALIVLELGADYLFQQRISSFVPSALAVTAWTIVWVIRPSNKPFVAPNGGRATHPGDSGATEGRHR